MQSISLIFVSSSFSIPFFDVFEVRGSVEERREVVNPACVSNQIQTERKCERGHAPPQSPAQTPGEPRALCPARPRATALLRT